MAAACMGCCPHAEAIRDAKIRDEIRQLKDLLGTYSTFKQAKAQGVVKLRAELRAAFAVRAPVSN